MTAAARPIVHCVTDRHRAGMSPAQLVERLAQMARQGAVDVIQVRERDLNDAELCALVRAAVAAVAGTTTKIVVNDRLDIAAAAGASGVHLRGDGAAASRARQIAPRGFLIGRSVHTSAEVAAAAGDGGCDYLIFGTVFPSAGKRTGHTVAGLAGLAEACRRTSLPVLAIGGVTDDRIAAVLEAGAAGFAAVGRFI